MEEFKRSRTNREKTPMLQSKETTYSKIVRDRIVLVMGLFVLILGAPLFLYTTRVHRALLPVSELDQRVDTFENAIKFKVPIYVNHTNENFIHILQQGSNEFLAKNTEIGLLWSLDFQPFNPEIDSYESFVLSLIDSLEADENIPLQSFVLSPYSKGVTILLPHLEEQNFDRLLEYVSDVLFNQVFKEEIDILTSLKTGRLSSDMSFPYSTEYSVVFNLFAQDGTPVDWEIESAVPSIMPVFRALKHYCRFKVSSQIQYYSKLTHDPVWDEEKKANILSLENLSTFINFGDWNLNNHEKTPSINFLIYFSDLNYQNIPLLVAESKTNSFSIPQWGGIHIYNPSMPLLEGSNLKISKIDLERILDIFASQLFELLGVPSSPVSPLMRIDSFQRISTYKNLKRSLNNLSALVKLSNSLSAISIPEATKVNVLDSLTYYDEALSKLQTSDFGASLENSGKCLQSSDKAFFEKEMLQQAHFPSEHKLAVFLPLLGPICSIVLFGVLKRFTAWRDERRKVAIATREKKEM